MFGNALGGGVVGRAVVEMVGDNAQLKKDFTDARTTAKSSTADMGKSTKGFSIVAAAAFAAAGAAAIRFGISAVRSAQESEKANIRLANTLQNNARLSDVATDSWERQAAAIQDMTGVSDEAITVAQSMLGTFELTGEEVQSLIPLVVDLSAKYGIDMTAATKAVGRAVSGSAGTLSRYGIIIDENAIKTDAYGAVMDGLRAKVGGFAEQEGKTLEGRLNILSNNWDDVKESAGAFIVDALVPMVTVLNRSIDAFNSIPGPMKTMMIGTIALTAAVVGLGLALNVVRTGLAGVGIQLSGLSVKAIANSTAVTAMGVGWLNLVAVAGSTAAALGVAALAIGAVVAAITTWTMAYRAWQDANKAHQESVEASGSFLEAYAKNVALGHHSMDEWKEKIRQVTNEEGLSADEKKKLTAEAGRLTSAIKSGSLAADANAEATEAQAEAHKEAAAAARKQMLAELSLAGGFVGLRSASISAKDATRELGQAQAKVTRLTNEGKKGTKEYRDALRERRDAEIDALDSQLGLASAVAQYIEEQATGKTSQGEVNRLVRDYGRMAGLSKDAIRGLIEQVAGLIRKYDELPKEKTTTVTTHYQTYGTGPYAGKQIPVAAGGVIAGASGFVTKGPTYLVGEGTRRTFAGRGAEAVVPLDDRGIGILAEAVRRGLGKDAVGGGRDAVLNLTLEIDGVAVARSVRLHERDNRLVLGRRR